MADNRGVSPYAPGRRAVLEWVRADFYSSNLFAAAALASASLFTAADANSGLFTNVEQPGQVASPKVLRVLGLRIHVAERATALDTTGADLYDLIAIINQLSFYWKVGPKDYLQQPLFSFPSGFGAWFSGTGAPAAATNMTYTCANGVPTFSNFMRFGKKVITMVPGQTFKAQFLVTNSSPATLAATRRVFAWFVCLTGREVM